MDALDDLATRRDLPFHQSDPSGQLGLAERNAYQRLVLWFLQCNVGHHRDTKALAHAGHDRADRVDSGHVLCHHPQARQFGVDQVGQRYWTLEPDEGQGSKRLRRALDFSARRRNQPKGLAKERAPA